MSLHLYESNSADTLAGWLARLLNDPRARGPDPDPFAEETVVVPNQGLARWLSLKIAEHNGLCPSIDFPYPGAFLYRYVFNPMTGRDGGDAAPEAEAELPFEPATVQWRILRLLAELEPLPAFGRVRTFVNADPFRRYQLAQRLAQLFDRYMTYRPDMLHAWERGEQPVQGGDAEWQRQLWKALIALDQGETRHFSGLYQRFLREPLEVGALPAFLAPLMARRRIFYFGISSLPPAHLDVLHRLSRGGVVELHLFAQNPCREEWCDARSLKGQLRDRATLVASVGAALALNYEAPSNPLLGSLGRSGREFFSLLMAYEEIDGVRDFTAPAPSDTSALATLQRDIVDNRLPERTRPLSPDDRSITIHSCHSPMREVEVLRDQLLSLFQEIPVLAPREIGVYVPDMETYAPYIDAVLGCVQPGEPGHLPYTIADKALLHEYPECKAFLALLAVGTSRFKASDVLGLLDHVPLRERFALSEEDVVRLARLLSQAHVAWGIDAGFRAEQGASGVYANTWQFALDRLILGAAMWDAPEDAEPLPLADGGCIPCAAADGHDALIGRLAEFFAALRELHDLCAAAPSRTCGDWTNALGRVLARFFAQDEKAPYGVILLRQTLDQFARHTDSAGCTSQEIPFAVVLSWLREQLGGAPGSERFLTGRLTFSRFQPMRNVPYRVVCMLGMNDGAYPRTAPQPSFDLMDSRTHRNLGDRQTRDEDRYAFLETLLAARERLVVTYTGQSLKDNKPLPPSVLVSELTDAVEASFVFPKDASSKDSSAAERLTVRHPLHPFSPEYFRNDRRDSRLVSFSQADHYVAARLLRNTEPETTSSAESAAPPPRSAEAASARPDNVIALSELIAFFRSPCKHYFTRQLGAVLEIRADQMPDDEEPLELDTLQRYSLKTELLLHEQDLSDEASLSRLLARFEAEGRLPPGSRRLLEESAEPVRALLARKVALALGAPIPPQTADIELPNGFRLRASFDRLYEGHRMLFLRPAKEKGKDVVEAGLHHLAACANALPVTTQCLYEDRAVDYRRIEPERALVTLNSLANLLLDTSRQPLCFCADLGWKIACDKTLSEQDWSGDNFAKKPPVDEYLRRAFGEELPEEGSPPSNTLAEVSARLFRTLMEVRNA